MSENKEKLEAVNLGSYVTGLQESTGADDRSYHAFQESVIEAYNRKVSESQKVEIYRTDVDGKDLFETYLNSLHPSLSKQHYNCNSCRKFIENFGGLATINPETKVLEPLFWDPTDESVVVFAESVTALYNKVVKAGVTGLFITSRSVLGVPQTGQWKHLHVELESSDVFYDPRMDAHEFEAEYKTAFTTLKQFMSETSEKTLRKVLGLFQFNAIDTSKADKFRKQTEDLLNLKLLIMQNKNLKVVDRIIWEFVGSRVPATSKVRSSVLGSLFEDIENSVDDTTAVREFVKKIDPLNYMRPTKEVSLGNAKRAEELVRIYNLEPALERRMATIDELPEEAFIWKPKAPVETDTKVKETAGLFTSLVKDNTEKTKMNRIEKGNMSWYSFAKNILIHADEIYVDFSKTLELLWGQSSNPMSPDCHFGGIVTAVNSDAEPLFKWDKPEQRNPFSQYVYHGAIRHVDIQRNKESVLDKFKVDGFVKFPADWYNEKAEIGLNMLVLSSDTKDISPNSLRIFPESVRHELHEVRSTIESFSNNKSLTPLSDDMGPEATGFVFGNPITFIVVNYATDTEYRCTISSAE